MTLLHLIAILIVVYIISKILNKGKGVQIRDSQKATNKPFIIIGLIMLLFGIPSCIYNSVIKNNLGCKVGISSFMVGFIFLLIGNYMYKIKSSGLRIILLLYILLGLVANLFFLVLFFVSAIAISTQKSFSRYLAISVSTFSVVNELCRIFVIRVFATNGIITPKQISSQVLSRNFILSIIVLLFNLSVIYYLTRPKVKEQFKQPASSSGL